jgi:hypothetical protein
MTRESTRGCALAGAFVVVVFAVLTSCATYGVSRERHRVVVAAPSAAAPAVERGPRSITHADTELLYTAEQLLIKACMRRAGFTYHPAPRNPVPGHRDFPYVVDDVDWARRHGYGSDLQNEKSRLAEVSPNRRYFENLPESRRVALGIAMNGPYPKGLRAYLPNGQLVEHSDKGCASEARRRLYENLPAWYRLVKLTESMSGLRNGLVTADPAYRKAVAQWSRCMRGSGFRYPTPAHSRAAGLAGNPLTGRATEIRLAVAEATCAGSSGLARTVKTLDRHYDGVLRRRFQSEMLTEQKLQVGALGRARAIVSRG